MINPEKFKGLRTVDDLFDEEYGNEGTESRKAFKKRAMEYMKKIENPLKHED